jgi:hypothetical protein
MKFVTIRDLATKNKKTREIISTEEAVLTYNGKPIGLIIPANEDNFEFMLKETAAILAKSAVSGMRKQAKKGVSEEEVLKEIDAARKKNKK